MPHITWSEIYIGTVTGIISSAVFLFLLWNLKPKFKISDKISLQTAVLNGENVDLYFFKIINRSLFFKVYDIYVEVKICNPVKNINGSNYDFTAIEIPFNRYNSLNRFNFRHYLQDLLCGQKTLSSRSDYALRFFTKHDLISELKDHSSSIHFQVIAKHSLTGFTRVQTMKYHHVLKIEKGSFLTGNSFKIVDQKKPPTITTD